MEELSAIEVMHLKITQEETKYKKALKNNVFLLRKGVSRMKRIDSSFQCCIRDGSRSAAYVMQLRCANHLKVLCSKGMMLNIRAKGSVKTLSGKCKEAECK